MSEISMQTTKVVRQTVRFTVKELVELALDRLLSDGNGYMGGNANVDIGLMPGLGNSSGRVVDAGEGPGVVATPTSPGISITFSRTVTE